MKAMDRLLDALLAAGGPAVRAVIVFGSRLVQTSPGRHSAWDLVVVVDDYGPFHRQLVAAGHHRRPAWLLSAMARILPPNITAFDPGDDRAMAKCAIVSARDFGRALGPRARDHFLKGRMVQKVAVAYAREPEIRRETEERLHAARRDVLAWVAPYLASAFTPEGFARRMLEVSYGGEVRPESEDRVGEVFLAQKDFLAETYTTILTELAAEGALEALPDGRYRLARPPGAMRRFRISLYFARSKVRATLRWLKHVLTFNDWITYIQRKVERRTGVRVEITPWERRLPLLLLWPKVIRVLRARRRSGDAAISAGNDP